LTVASEMLSCSAHLTIAQTRRYQNRDLTLARGQCREQRSSAARSGRAAHHDQWKTEVLYRIKINGERERWIEAPAERDQLGGLQISGAALGRDM
jgi:hypothetical protein